MPQSYIRCNDFLRYIQCKKTWFLRNTENNKETQNLPRNRIRDRDPENYTLVVEKKFRDYTYSLFPPLSPSEVMPDNLDLDQKIKFTRKLIKKGQKLVISGWFEYSNIALFVDILEFNQNWNAYSIRTGGQGFGTNYLDLALQYFILLKNDLDINSFWVIYLNKRYHFDGSMNPSRLLRIRDCLSELADNISLIEKKLEEIKHPLDNHEIKKIDIGNHCFHPSPCKYMNICWSHIPANSVFEIASLERDRKFQMYQRGILLQKDIPVDEYPLFNPNQLLQIKSTISQKSSIHSEELGNFLNRIQYPVHYLDFESFMPMIPLFPNTRPFQHIPFEYCLYKRFGKETSPEFRFFLAETFNKSGIPVDPRREFFKNLLNDLENNGSILVYDSRLEIKHLREISALYPEFSDMTESIVSRIIDLTIPFQKKYYYTPAMQGLYSIKNIIPALLPEFTYENLVIKNGYMAMRAFESLFYETSAEKINQTRVDLMEYCKTDVFAMVEIHKFLENLVLEYF